MSFDFSVFSPLFITTFQCGNFLLVTEVPCKETGISVRIVSSKQFFYDIACYHLV